MLIHFITHLISCWRMLSKMFPNTFFHIQWPQNAIHFLNCFGIELVTSLYLWASGKIRKIAVVRMHRECRKRFPRQRDLAIPTCIMARAWSTCHDACQGRKLAVTFEVGGGRSVPGIPAACSTRNSTYLVRGLYESRVRTTRHGHVITGICNHMIPCTQRPSTVNCQANCM